MRTLIRISIATTIFCICNLLGEYLFHTTKYDWFCGAVTMAIVIVTDNVVSTIYASRDKCGFTEGGIIPKSYKEDISVVISEGYWECRKCGAKFYKDSFPPFEHNCIEENKDGDTN